MSLAQAGGCKRWQQAVEFEGEFANPAPLPLCAARSQDQREQHRTSWLIGYGVARQGMEIVNACGGWLQRNPGRDGYTDALGRRFLDDCSLYTHPEGPGAEYGWGGYSLPEPCPTVAPTPTPAGPTPTPSGPVTGSRRDFMVGWTNVSDRARGFKDLGNGVCRFEPDGAIRYKATLTPQEKFVQNVCDRDHWFLAVEPRAKPEDKTLDEWAEILQAHRDTFQMCDGDEWITPSGITYQGNNVLSIERASNPYQAVMTARCGETVEIRGCVAADAYACPGSRFECEPHERRPIPGAGGCGPWKSFEVKP